METMQGFWKYTKVQFYLKCIIYRGAFRRIYLDSRPFKMFHATRQGLICSENINNITSNKVNVMVSESGLANLIRYTGTGWYKRGSPVWVKTENEVKIFYLEGRESQENMSGITKFLHPLFSITKVMYERGRQTLDFSC